MREGEAAAGSVFNLARSPPNPSPPSRLWNRAKWNGGGRKELIGAGGGGGGKNDEIEENIHKKGKKQMKDIFMFFKEGKRSGLKFCKKI